MRNCDSTHKSSVNLSGCGGFLRDSSGVCLVSYARKLETYVALYADMWGMYLSMNLAMREGIMHLQVDNDSKVLVDMVRRNYTINKSIPTSAYSCSKKYELAGSYQPYLA
jgi:hypothetical protein